MRDAVETRREAAAMVVARLIAESSERLIALLTIVLPRMQLGIRGDVRSVEIRYVVFVN